jgi:hypothetical protein
MPPLDDGAELDDGSEPLLDDGCGGLLTVAVVPRDELRW